jgi:hypothetical protein
VLFDSDVSSGYVVFSRYLFKMHKSFYKCIHRPERFVFLCGFFWSTPGSRDHCAFLYTRLDGFGLLGDVHRRLLLVLPTSYTMFVCRYRDTQ